MTAERTCDLAPFTSPVVAQVATLEQAGSAVEILTQSLENFLSRFKNAVCEDFEEIVSECCGGGPSTLSFLDLTDTPNTYAGSAGKLVAVNGAQTGLEFINQPTPPSTYFITPRVISMWSPAVVTNPFGATPTVVGSGQIQVPTNPANALDANYRQSFTSGTGANAVAGARSNVFQAIRGTATPMGGFRLRWRFGIELYNAGARCWIGLHANAAAFPSGATDPSANTNVIYLGFDDTDTNWQIMHNDNALACTKVDLGAGFAINTTSLLELTLEMEPSSDDLNYTLRDLEQETETSGTTSGNMPQGGQPLALVMQIGTAATGAAQRISTIFMSLEVGPGE